jgi:hypothetical protein
MEYIALMILCELIFLLGVCFTERYYKKRKIVEIAHVSEIRLLVVFVKNFRNIISFLGSQHNMHGYNSNWDEFGEYNWKYIIDEKYCASLRISDVVSLRRACEDIYEKNGLRAPEWSIKEIIPVMDGNTGIYNNNVTDTRNMSIWSDIVNAIHGLLKKGENDGKPRTA